MNKIKGERLGKEFGELKNKPKINKEKIKQIALIITSIFFMCVGYFNYSFNTKEKTVEVARTRIVK